ncbi:NADH:flavin oxidoreductase/NADH oxidase [Castellaniella defragrans 65Phen]|uniref:NADH:flavin oxidoreductase/NADH oxidase n=2 Tax=Castellaniella defragrans TaxID=75697 RepID=W8WXT3_CASD6|nr:alkene reductase [Castellaniella defragrans]MBB6084808.1 2,4-dienoyl-CoA reductase-like NADH-dependent reductase (Old Yellow Enzyme family) [Castellaniella defragrans]CDM24568.1 NADH:flavin oxidoreductase/NADH oxidase [Castellaniella defragrans 65Phen]
MFDPVRLGEIELPNRIVMAPAAGPGSVQCRVPDEGMRAYYAQRADAGLILAGAASVSPLGIGHPNTPGIWNSSQAQAWRTVTDTVHRRGGRIVLQLWHAGRVSDPEYLSGEMPVAPSAIPCGRGPCPQAGGFVVPRSLRLDEIRRVIADFEQAARHAWLAEFDGVEVHAGDGYLIDQFLHDGSNGRQDDYGGSVCKRSRFLLEIVEACAGIWGAGRVGVHLSPRGDRYDMRDSDPAALYRHVARELGQRRVAFICVREHEGPDALAPVIRDAFSGALVLSEGYDPASALRAVQAERGEAVAFGRAFVRNPDLVRRLRAGQPLVPEAAPAEPLAAAGG